MNDYQYNDAYQMPQGTMQMPYGMDQNMGMQMPYGMNPHMNMQMPYGMDPNMNMQMPYGMDPNMQMPYGNNYPHENMQMPYAGEMKDVSPESLKDFCKKHKHYFVGMETTDGSQYEGIIERTDHDRVSMLVPDGDNPGDQDYRQFGFGGFGGFGGYPYGYGGFGGYGGYGYPRRFRRFRRFTFPFGGISRFFFPFFF